MRDVDFGEHVAAGDGHWGLEHHDEIFRLKWREFKDDRLLKSPIHRIFNGPASFELRLRIHCLRLVVFVSLERQIFWVERRQQVMSCLS